jgi:hypothetical protein
MKNYSSNKAQKGKTAFRTPSGWLAGRPESIKRDPRAQNKKGSWKKTTNSTYFGGRGK